MILGWNMILTKRQNQDLVKFEEVSNEVESLRIIESDRVEDLTKDMKKELNSVQVEGIKSLSRKKEMILKEVSKDFDLRREKFKKEIENIHTKIESEKVRLKQIKDERVRVDNNLPEIRTLEELYNKYRNFEGKEFITSQGVLKIRKYDLDIVKVPSTGKVASMRFGKSTTDEKSILIKAFLEEATESKLDNGYVLYDKEEKTIDYGDYTKEVYHKSDSYFTTYYQKTRYKGKTYNSTHYRYEYYIELGSLTRMEQFQKEQYSKSLGF
jgi:hypothetical protein